MDSTRKIVRTRTGCANCKSRRVRCDKATPFCLQCTKRRLDCPGYRKTFRWVNDCDKPESFKVGSTTRHSGPLVPVVQHTVLPQSVSQPRQVQQHVSLHQNLTTSKDMLTQYYFSTVCVMISGFDSPKSPFRTNVADMIHREVLVYDCVLSVSAARFYQQSQRLETDALLQRTDAISRLSSKLALLAKQGESSSCAQLVPLLLGSLLLGMTSTWHDTSALGLPFLRGARALMRSITCKPINFELRLLFNFLIGAVAFWEALASFHPDQDLPEVDYLLPLCKEFDARAPQLHPWTGTTTTLFIYVAQVGSLTHQKRFHARSFLTGKSGERKTAELLKNAKDVELRLQNYNISLDGVLNTTDDDCTPASHFRLSSQAYKLVALLELYRVFPELIVQSNLENNGIAGSSANTRYISFLLDLAIQVLATISSIPITSRTKAVQQLPLVVAGSALQHLTSGTTTHHHSTLLDITHEETLLSETELSIESWRHFVRERLMLISNYVGLESAQRGCRIVESVWKEADKQSKKSQNLSSVATSELIDWTNIMREQNLTTLLG